MKESDASGGSRDGQARTKETNEVATESARKTQPGNECSGTSATEACHKNEGVPRKYWWLELINAPDYMADENCEPIGQLVVHLFDANNLDVAMTTAESLGMTTAVQILLSAGAMHPMARAIRVAVDRADASELRRLLELVPPCEWTRSDAKRKGFDADYLLWLAAGAGHEDTVSLLLERTTGNMNAALVQAASRGQLGAVRLLVEAGGDPRYEGECAMREAVEQCHGDVARYLSEQGCDVWKAISNRGNPERLF